MSTTNTLREQRAKLVADQRLIIAAADSEGRGMTADEIEKFDKLDADIVGIKATIDRDERVAAEEAAQRNAYDNYEPLPESRAPATLTVPVGTEARTGTASDEYRAAFEACLRGENFEARALEVGTASEGGNLVPDSWASQIIDARSEANVMRPLSTVVTSTGGTFNLPTVSTQGTASWTAEEASYTESDPAFGNVAFSAHKIGTLVKVSDELLRDSAFDLGSYLSAEFGRRIGRLEEAAFIDGDDSSKPKGIIYNSGVGVTAASATAITAAEVISLYHSLGQEYRSNAVFITHDDTAKLIRSLADSNGQYLWQPGLREGTPDTLFGRRVYTSSTCNAPTAAKKTLVFCDPSYYWIVDRQGINVQILRELYAATGQVGFRASSATDGELVLAEASKVLQMAAS